MAEWLSASQLVLFPYSLSLFSLYMQDENLSANSVQINSSATDRSALLFSFVGQIYTYKLLPHTCATESEILRRLC